MACNDASSLPLPRAQCSARCDTRRDDCTREKSAPRKSLANLSLHPCVPCCDTPRPGRPDSGVRARRPERDCRGAEPGPRRRRRRRRRPPRPSGDRAAAWAVWGMEPPSRTPRDCASMRRVRSGPGSERGGGRGGGLDRVGPARVVSRPSSSPADPTGLRAAQARPRRPPRPWRGTPGRAGRGGRAARRPGCSGTGRTGP